MCIKRDGCEDCRQEALETKAVELLEHLHLIWREANEIYRADPTNQQFANTIMGVMASTRLSMIELEKVTWNG